MSEISPDSARQISKDDYTLHFADASRLKLSEGKEKTALRRQLGITRGAQAVIKYELGNRSEGTLPNTLRQSSDIDHIELGNALEDAEKKTEKARHDKALDQEAYDLHTEDARREVAENPGAFHQAAIEDAQAEGETLILGTKK